MALARDTFEFGSQNVNVCGDHLEGCGRGFFEMSGSDFKRFVVGTETNCFALSQKTGADTTLNCLTLSVS